MVPGWANALQSLRRNRAQVEPVHIYFFDYYTVAQVNTSKIPMYCSRVACDPIRGKLGVEQCGVLLALGDNAVHSVADDPTFGNSMA